MEVAVEKSLHRLCRQVFGKHPEVGLQFHLVEVDLRSLEETVLEVVQVEEHAVLVKLRLRIALGEVQSPRPPDLYVGQLAYRPSQQVHLLEVVASARLPSALYGVEERDVAQVGLQVAHLVVACGQYLRHG